jgi:hypothetical protein
MTVLDVGGTIVGLGVGGLPDGIMTQYGAPAQPLALVK